MYPPVVEALTATLPRWATAPDQCNLKSAPAMRGHFLTYRNRSAQKLPPPPDRSHQIVPIKMSATALSRRQT
ncbi:MAG: hypothetical protein ACO4AI_00555, partial [Prochlorothrix sp.]